MVRVAARTLRATYEVGELLADDRVLADAEVPRHLDEAREAGRRRRPPPPPPIAARSFISVVSATRPALVDVTEAVRVGDADLVEEHLVERRAAGHLAQRAHLDAGRVHVDDEAS